MSENSLAEMGTLYIIATPIGHPDDITLRALRTLREVDLLAAEDTRHIARLLSHHGIQANLISFTNPRKPNGPQTWTGTADRK